LVHADFAALVALAVTHKDRAAVGIKVTLRQGERLADPQTRAPHDHDQPTQPQTMRAIAGVTYHEHDLLNAPRISRVSHPLFRGVLRAAIRFSVA
jgi:hypothetical protein